MDKNEKRVSIKSDKREIIFFNFFHFVLEHWWEEPERLVQKDVPYSSQDRHRRRWEMAGCAAQSQKAVTAYFSSKQLLPFGFAEK